MHTPFSLLILGIAGSGIAQWLQRTCDQMVTGSSPSRSGGRISFSGVTLSVLTLILVSVVTAVACKKIILIILPKVQVESYS